MYFVAVPSSSTFCVCFITCRSTSYFLCIYLFIFFHFCYRSTLVSHTRTRFYIRWHFVVCVLFFFSFFFFVILCMCVLSPLAPLIFYLWRMHGFHSYRSTRKPQPLLHSSRFLPTVFFCFKNNK